MMIICVFQKKTTIFAQTKAYYYKYQYVYEDKSF